MQCGCGYRSCLRLVWASLTSITKSRVCVQQSSLPVVQVNQCRIAHVCTATNTSRSTRFPVVFCPVSNVRFLEASINPPTAYELVSLSVNLAHYHGKREKSFSTNMRTLILQCISGTCYFTQYSSSSNTRMSPLVR